jgi:hypothetical protein
MEGTGIRSGALKKIALPEACKINLVIKKGLGVPSPFFYHHHLHTFSLYYPVQQCTRKNLPNEIFTNKSNNVIAIRDNIYRDLPPGHHKKWRMV